MERLKQLESKQGGHRCHQGLPERRPGLVTGHPGASQRHAGVAASGLEVALGCSRRHGSTSSPRTDCGLRPVDLEPVDLEPVDLEPVDLEPVDLEPVEGSNGGEILIPIRSYFEASKKEGAYLSTPLIDDAAYLLRVPNKTNVHLILSSPDGIGTTKNLKSCSTKPYGRTVRLRITNGVRILGRNLLLKNC